MTSDEPSEADEFETIDSQETNDHVEETKSEDCPDTGVSDQSGDTSPELGMPQRSNDTYATQLPGDADATIPLAPKGAEAPELDTYATEAQGDLGLPAEHGDYASRRLRFRKVRYHAEGGLGRVSLAQDNELRRNVAVKEIKEAYADLSESRARFIFEAEVTGRLEHPGVVPVYALGRHPDGRPYYAMRFITGEPMDKSIKQLHKEKDRDKHDRLLRDLLNNFVSVCNTIHYAHSRGFVHRDLKPANIMLGDYGETLVVDWGLAKQLDSDHDGEAQKEEAAEAVPMPLSQGEINTGGAVGTLLYMPPEQAAGAGELIAPASDVYALGATLYHIVAGLAPFQKRKDLKHADIIKRICNGEVPSASEVNPSVGKALNAVCEKAMKKQPTDRYASARELANDIERYLADEAVSVLPDNLFTAGNRWMRKHRGITNAVGISLLVITAIVGVAYAITKNSLTQTQRLYEIAQLEQEFDGMMTEESDRLRSLDGSSLPIRAPIGGTFVTDSKRIVDSIEELRSVHEGSAILDDGRRKRMLEVWERSLEELSSARMNRANHQLLEAQLVRLESEFPWPELEDFDSAVSRLSDLVRARTTAWYGLETSDLAEHGFKDRDGWFERVESDYDEDPIVLARAEPGNQEISAQFTGKWMESLAVGVVLSQTEEGAYRFLLASEEYDPNLGFASLSSTIGEALRNDRLSMFITRDGISGASVLRREPYRSLDYGAPLPQMLARRESGNEFTFRIGQDQIQFVDPLPILTADAGENGLICPKNCGVLHQSLAVNGQRYEAGNANQVTDMGLADRALAAGQFAEALAIYERVARAEQDGANIEALFKQALCHSLMREPEQHTRILESIVEQGAEGILNERQRQYYLFAGVRLILEKIGQEDKLVEATVVISQLSTSFVLADMQRLIPESERNTFYDVLLKPGKRSRMVFDNREEIGYLRDVIKSFSGLFSNNALWYRLARWRLADAHQAEWGIDQADARANARPILLELLKELDDLIAQGASVDDAELTTLIRDLVWLDLLDGEEDRALALVESYLPDQAEEPRAGLLPLLIDRARCNYARNEKELAQADIETVISRIDPKNPPSGIYHAHYAEACVISGLLHEEKGDIETAKERWRMGRRRNWIEWYDPPHVTARLRGWEMILESEAPEPYLQGRTDGYTDYELESFLEVLFAGSGMDSSFVRNVAMNNELLPMEIVETAAEMSFVCDRGKELGEQVVLRQKSMRDGNIEAIGLALYAAVLYITFDGEETLERYEEFDPLLFKLVLEIMGGFQSGDFGVDEIKIILDGFAGNWSESAYSALTEKLESRALKSGIALIFARMYVNKTNRTERGRQIIINHVLKYKDDDLPEVITALANDTLTEFTENASQTSTQE